MANSNFRTIGVDQLDGVKSVRNFIKNGSANQNTRLFATYANTAASAPTTGTGGSPTVTLTRTTTTPLTGDGSFLFTKTAANSQGQGFSYDFDIDAGYQAQVLSINFLLGINSGTYATGDVAVYIVDKTNGTVIQPSAYQLINSTIAGPAQTMSFQTASNSTAYRLCFHVASTSALAYTLKIDGIEVCPQVSTIGYIGTDSVSYTPSLINGTNVTITKATWSRSGENMILAGLVTATGTGSGSTFTVSLPTGYTIDTTKMQSNISNQILGRAAYLKSGTGRSGYSVTYFNTTAFGFESVTSGVGPFLGGNFATGDQLSWQVEVPIVGWSSSSVSSDSAASRVVAVSASGATTALTSTIADIIFPTKTQDTHGAQNTSTGAFVAPVPGFYDFTAYLSHASTAFGTGNTVGNTFYSINGGTDVIMDKLIAQTSVTSVFDTRANATSVYLNAGDVLKIRANTSVNHSLTGGTFGIHMVQGPAQIQAATIVSAALSGSTTVTTAGVNTDIVPTTSSLTAGSISGASVTVPTAGRYKITGMARSAAGASWAASNSLFLYYSINAGTDIEIGSMYAQTSHNLPMSASGSDEVTLNAGDVVKFRIFTTPSVTVGAFKGQITRITGIN